MFHVLKMMYFLVLVLLIIPLNAELSCGIIDPNGLPIENMYTMKIDMANFTSDLIAQLETVNIKEITMEKSSFLFTRLESTTLNIFIKENVRHQDFFFKSNYIIDLQIEFICKNNVTRNISLLIEDTKKDTEKFEAMHYEYVFGMKIPSDYVISSFKPIRIIGFDKAYFVHELNDFFYATYKGNKGKTNYIETSIKALKDIEAPFEHTITLTAMESEDKSKKKIETLVTIKVIEPHDNAEEGSTSIPPTTPVIQLTTPSLTAITSPELQTSSNPKPTTVENVVPTSPTEPELHPPVFLKHYYILNYTDNILQMDEKVTLKYGTSNTSIKQTDFVDFIKVTLDQKNYDSLNIEVIKALPTEITTSTNMIFMEIVAKDEILHISAKTALIIQIYLQDLESLSDTGVSIDQVTITTYVNTPVIMLSVALVGIVLTNIITILWYMNVRMV